MIESQVVEASFITDTSNTWCIDSGAINHICNTLQGFRSTRQFRNEEIKFTLASNATISVVTMGVVVLVFQNNRTLVLLDVQYVPNLRRDLIYVSKLVNKGFSVNFANEFIIKRNNLFICFGVETNGLYVITPIVSNKHDLELNNSVVTVPSKRKEPFSNPTKLWHIKLGHINLNRINKLVNDGILDNLVL